MVIIIITFFMVDFVKNIIIYLYMKNNFYEILGVTPDSELSEIKSAYRTLARKFHPDVAPDCLEKFKQINEAYETLSNERKRMQYNMLFGFYKKGVNNSEFESSSFEAFRKGAEFKGSTPSPKQSTFESKKENKKEEKKKRDEKNFFDELFASSSKNVKEAPQNGTDLYADIMITIPEATSGVSKVVNVLHTEQCPKCRGRKFINGTSCCECNGTGEKNRQRKITVKVPPKVSNDTKLRLKGEGNVGKNGGKNGDLFLTIKIEGNKNVRYEGQKVFYDVPIEPFEAVLGTSVSLKTLEGNILVKIPPRTKNGQKFRIQQNVDGKVYEIFVTAHIEFPAYLSDDEVKLYEKLRKLSNSNLRENFIDG